MVQLLVLACVVARDGARFFGSVGLFEAIFSQFLHRGARV